MSKIEIQERTTPEQLAEFILKERICKNCKWWARLHGGMGDKYGQCRNDLSSYPPEIVTKEDFGCNQWEKKG